MSDAAVIQAKNINKAYGKEPILKGIDLTVKKGRIVGLIGPNGAGKTTLLKGLLGLATVSGQLSVLGLNPVKSRTALIEKVSFIADTAILPRWLRVADALDYMTAMHPRFERERAEMFLAKTKIPRNKRVAMLSKGMITQLHLALVMAIDSELLVLDEPTLGLDIVYRKQFYSTLLNDYFDEEKTILITTHQVEEIEHILTDLVFINDGAIVLDMPMDEVSERYFELEVTRDTREEILKTGLKPIGEQARLGGSQLLFEGGSSDHYAKWGSVKAPSVADLFVAKVSQEGAL